MSTHWSISTKPPSAPPVPSSARRRSRTGQRGAAPSERRAWPACRRRSDALAAAKLATAPTRGADPPRRYQRVERVGDPGVRSALETLAVGGDLASPERLRSRSATPHVTLRTGSSRRARRRRYSLRSRRARGTMVSVMCACSPSGCRSRSGVDARTASTSSTSNSCTRRPMQHAAGVTQARPAVTSARHRAAGRAGTDPSR